MIRSYTTVINRKSLGLEVEAFVQISLERQAPENVRHMHETISRMPEVRECYVMTGSIDYLLHIVTTSLDAFADLISKTVLMLPGVKDVRSSFVLKCTKREPGLYVV